MTVIDKSSQSLIPNFVGPHIHTYPFHLHLHIFHISANQLCTVQDFIIYLRNNRYSNSFIIHLSDQIWISSFVIIQLLICYRCDHNIRYHLCPPLSQSLWVCLSSPSVSHPHGWMSSTKRTSPRDWRTSRQHRVSHPWQRLKHRSKNHDPDLWLRPLQWCHLSDLNRSFQKQMAQYRMT